MGQGENGGACEGGVVDILGGREIANFTDSTILFGSL